MTGPIERLLKDTTQVAVARLEDSVVSAIYEIDPKIVLHGGTAIWRCYGGQRFSSDVDLYLTDSQVKRFNRELTWKISKYDMKHDPASRNGREVRIFNDAAQTKLEAMRTPPRLKSVPALYELSDGTRMAVRTLSVDDFIKEKMDTYLKRLYVRDFFDVYQLVINHEVGPDIRKAVLSFIDSAPKPKGVEVLRSIVYIGAAPTFADMVDSIHGRLNEIR